MSKNELMNIGFFDKVRNWFRKLFHKEDNLNTNLDNVITEKKPVQEPIDEFQKFKEQGMELQRINDLQNRFENDLLDIDELPDDDKIMLKRLYISQIVELKKKVEKVGNKA